MREARISLYHHGCWCPETSEAFPELKIELASYPMFIKKNKKSAGVFSALWRFSHPEKGAMAEVRDFVRALKTTKKMRILEKSSHSMTAMITLHTEGLAMDKIFDNKCHLVAPPTIANGLEHWDIVTEDVTEVRRLLSELSEVGELTIHKIGRYKPKTDAFSMTECQVEALRLAVCNGYYSWPKSITLDELAGVAKVSRVTFENHLRKAEEHVIPTAVNQVAFSGKLQLDNGVIF